MPRQFFGSTESLADAAPLKLNLACLDVSLIEIFIFLALIKLRQFYRFNVFLLCKGESHEECKKAMGKFT
ncbi:hypothetical protein [Nostoc sp. UCD121]|uniref:hypothetical protein n=1 Tax=Nostoc sp. UCD121 TaxID=2681305 RepID=UPI001628C054|nr:hypothetical protein [Nostoc sp. UCD121]MBC1224434.1 hypothetical protein [Nostoc sp. UCD120]